VVMQARCPLLAGRRLEQEARRMVRHIVERSVRGWRDGDDALAAVLRKRGRVRVRRVGAAILT
jgi:hypothetical protein